MGFVVTTNLFMATLTSPRCRIKQIQRTQLNYFTMPYSKHYRLFAQIQIQVDCPLGPRESIHNARKQRQSLKVALFQYSVLFVCKSTWNDECLQVRQRGPSKNDLLVGLWVSERPVCENLLNFS